jgi:hypothetical protein
MSKNYTGTAENSWKLHPTKHTIQLQNRKWSNQIMTSIVTDYHTSFDDLKNCTSPISKETESYER